ncbi:hypothetical protein N9777_03135 [Ascidiaceihabitans sp.]|nr:hypothetical protein [Ascidiaceihabitans sp.]
MFRTDVLTAEGSYNELPKAEDLAMRQAAVGTWFLDGSKVHVNIRYAPSSEGIASIRG